MFDDSQAVHRRLAELRLEHRDLDQAIAALTERPFPDQIQLIRLKKRRLQLKDAIARLESSLIPDMPA